MRTPIYSQNTYTRASCQGSLESGWPTGSHATSRKYPKCGPLFERLSARRPKAFVFLSCCETSRPKYSTSLCTGFRKRIPGFRSTIVPKPITFACRYNVHVPKGNDRVYRPNYLDDSYVFFRLLFKIAHNPIFFQSGLKFANVRMF